MNIKKIVALGLSSVMLFSTVIANAAFEYEDGNITKLPTRAEMLERQPKVTFTVGEQFKDQTAAIADLAKAQQNALKKETGRIYFPLTVTVSDLGTLGAGWCDIGEGFAGGVMLNAMTVNVNNTNIKSSYLTNSSAKINGVKWLTAIDNVGTQYAWQAGTFMNSYPSVADVDDPTYAIIDENTFSATYVVSVDENIKNDIVIGTDDVVASIDYWVGDEKLTPDFGADSISVKATATNGITFKAPVAPTPVEDKWSVVIDNATGDMAATEDNKVWSVKPSKTGTPADISKFDLTLTSGEDSIVKSIETADLNKIMNAWNTGFEFFIGFENVGNHENVTAAWDIAAGTTAIVPTGTAIN